MTTRLVWIVLAGSVLLAQQTQSPAEAGIQKAQAQIAKHPNHYPYYNDLAMAYARRARETSDVALYGKAEETLQKSFAIAPDNFEGLRVQTWLLLGRHEFAKGLESATRLNRRTPDDITVYGYLADANSELGNYADAVAAAQWMLNIRPGNVPGLTRAAYQRELHGDADGAIELMQMAYDSTPYDQNEDRAWLLTQLAHLHLLNGDLAKSEMYASGALAIFPDYHYALGALAQVRVAQKRYQDAAVLLRKRVEEAPHAENWYAAARVFELAGLHAEGERAFAEFERRALAESGWADNANHELIGYYTDVAHKPTEALKLARQELARRHDVFTLDCYAWALAANGDYSGADAEIHKALAVGVKDPTILYHAGAIALHCQRPEEAARYLKEAASRFSPDAARLLASREPVAVAAAH
jgi:tetratricopeptide (TPR) repeat protein